MVMTTTTIMMPQGRLRESIPLRPGQLDKGPRWHPRRPSGFAAGISIFNAQRTVARRKCRPADGNLDSTWPRGPEAVPLPRIGRRSRAAAAQPRIRQHVRAMACRAGPPKGCLEEQRLTPSRSPSSRRPTTGDAVQPRRRALLAERATVFSFYCPFLSESSLPPQSSPLVGFPGVPAGCGPPYYAFVGLAQTGMRLLSDCRAGQPSLHLALLRESGGEGEERGLRWDKMINCAGIHCLFFTSPNSPLPSSQSFLGPISRRAASISSTEGDGVGRGLQKLTVAGVT